MVIRTVGGYYIWAFIKLLMAKSKPAPRQGNLGSAPQKPAQSEDGLGRNQLRIGALMGSRRIAPLCLMCP